MPLAARHLHHTPGAVGATLEDAPFREKPLHFGLDGRLVGILTRPGRPSSSSTPAMVLLNAGVIHRVGPHRLHVNVARRLARMGMSSLRLDLSGIGDGGPIPGELSFRESVVADTKATMDWLSEQGIAKQFVLFGLCSGAQNAVPTAIDDRRVTGLVLLDPPAYVTRQARMRQAMSRVSRMVHPGAVKAASAGVLRRVGRLFEKPQETLEDDETVAQRELPTASEFGAQLTTLVERGVFILAVYSGSRGEFYNHPDQLFELYPHLRGRLHREYFAEANHTFTEVAAQTALVSSVCDWAGRAYALCP